MKKIIHIDQHSIRENRKTGSRKPVITVKTYKSNQKAYGVIIHGPSKLCYQPDDPLSCGATVWIETHSDVSLSE